MKTLLYSAAAIFLSLAIFFTFFLEKNKNFSHGKIQGIEIDSFLSLAQEGDIILKQGGGPISKRIVKALNEVVPFSHLGIMCKQDDSFFIVHSISKDLADKDGVQTISVNHFIGDSKPGTVWLVRKKGNEILGKQIQEIAVEMATQNIPFDKEFNHSDNSKIYCSELAFEIFNRLQVFIPYNFASFEEVEVIEFSSFIDTQYFEVVYK